jgi:hypothetical protein
MRSSAKEPTATARNTRIAIDLFISSLERTYY